MEIQRLRAVAYKAFKNINELNPNFLRYFIGLQISLTEKTIFFTIVKKTRVASNTKTELKREN